MLATKLQVRFCQNLHIGYILLQNMHEVLLKNRENQPSYLPTIPTFCQRFSGTAA